MATGSMGTKQRETAAAAAGLGAAKAELKEDPVISTAAIILTLKFICI